MQLTRHHLLRQVGSLLLCFPLNTVLMACAISAPVSPQTSPFIQSKPMRIFLKRTGGFTGVPLSVTVDTSTLPSAEATHLRELLEAADFFQLPTRFPATPQPDRFQYQITVEDADRSHSVTVGETAVPPTLKPLLNGVMDAGQQP